MRMLDDLKECLEHISREDEWAYDFVTDIMIRKGENPDYKLTKKQFAKLQEIHNRYRDRWPL